MHTGTMNRRQLVDQAQGRLERAYIEKSSSHQRCLRLEAELEEARARDKTCDAAITTAAQELHEATRAPELAPAAPTPAAAAVREFAEEVLERPEAGA